MNKKWIVLVEDLSGKWHRRTAIQPTLDAASADVRRRIPASWRIVSVVEAE